MQIRRRRRWQFGIRALLVGVTGAALAVYVAAFWGIPGDFVILAAGLFAVLIEAAIHRRGLRWVLRLTRRR